MRKAFHFPKKKAGGTSASNISQRASHAGGERREWGGAEKREKAVSSDRLGGEHVETHYEIALTSRELTEDRQPWSGFVSLYVESFQE